MCAFNCPEGWRTTRGWRSRGEQEIPCMRRKTRAKGAEPERGKRRRQPVHWAKGEDSSSHSPIGIHSILILKYEKYWICNSVSRKIRRLRHFVSALSAHPTAACARPTRFPGFGEGRPACRASPGAGRQRRHSAAMAGRSPDGLYQRAARGCGCGQVLFFVPGA